MNVNIESYSDFKFWLCTTYPDLYYRFAHDDREFSFDKLCRGINVTFEDIEEYHGITVFDDVADFIVDHEILHDLWIL